MAISWILLFLSSYAYSQSTNALEIIFEDTTEYTRAIDPNGCPGACATAMSMTFKSDRQCDGTNAFSCICGNATASSILRDQIWDNCFTSCGYKAAYPATSILPGYCSSNSRQAAGVPATNTATPTPTPGEIYFEDTTEHMAAMEVNGCGPRAAVFVVRSFKAAHTCDPVDSYECICTNATASALLHKAIFSACTEACNYEHAVLATRILPGYCASNSRRLEGKPATNTATTTQGLSSSGTMRPGPSQTGGSSAGPRDDGGFTPGEKAGVIVGTVFGFLAVVVAIGIAVYQRKRPPTAPPVSMFSWPVYHIFHFYVHGGAGGGENAARPRQLLDAPPA